MNVIRILRIVPTLLAAVVLASCGASPTPAGATESAATVAVDVTSASTADWPSMIEAGGTVSGRSAATVASRILATVTAVRVRVGERVEAGQVLVELDGADLAAGARVAVADREAADRHLAGARAAAAATAAAAALASATLSRIEPLAVRGSATPHELDEVRAAATAAGARALAASAAIDAAAADVSRAVAGGERASAMAAWARVIAPFAGVVTEIDVDPGDLVSPGTSLARVEDTRALELEVKVDAGRVASVREGTAVRVLVDDAEGVVEVDGRVAEVARAVGVDDRATSVTVTLAGSPAVRPGAYARAQWPGAARREMRVPATALVSHGQLTSVFVVADAHARMRLVHAGISDGRDVTIAAGVSDGERVVVNPAPSLRDGSPVTVRMSMPSGSPR